MILSVFLTSFSADAYNQVERLENMWDQVCVEKKVFPTDFASSVLKG